MQCPRCGFHNLPGTEACLSCRVPFGRGAAAVGTLSPPRATAWSKRSRRVRGLLRAFDRMGRWVPTTRRALLGLVPGLPQLVLGWRTLGGAIFAAWTVFLALAFFWLGTTWAVVFSGMALSAHVMSALLPYLAAMQALPLRRRCLVSLLAWAGLLLLVYFPLSRALDHFVFPLRFTENARSALVQGGDVILVRRRDGTHWRPAAGSLVVFQHAWGTATMDRVIGVAGDRIEVRDGRVWRNGRELSLEELPLVPSALPPLLDVVVPADSVFVWPSLGLRIYNTNDWVFAAVGTVPLRSLVGEPTRIWQPLSRRRRLE